MKGMNNEPRVGLDIELKRIGAFEPTPPPGLDDAVIGAITHADVVRKRKRITAVSVAGLVVGGALRALKRSRHNHNGNV
ncbi:MAG: hypothetical protein WBD02_05510 [Acidimicrobiia bacterium]